MKELQTNRFYDFGAFRLDAGKRRLARGEEIISLTPKEFELLFVLVKNAGRVVEKDDLLDAVWKDTFVEEGTLTRNISWLRKKLARFGETDAPFIETIPKRGYRFLPEVASGGAQNALLIEEPARTRTGIEETLAIPERVDAAHEMIVPPRAAASDSALHSNPRSEINNPKSKRLALAAAFAGILALGAIAYFVALKPATEPKAVLVSKVAPFSGLAGREDMPSFSPDGKQLVFSWNGGEAETSSIYVKLIGAGEPLRLTSAARNDLYPAFSPDARQIAFVRAFSTHSELIMIPALGGAERKICTLNSFASVSFSPDGQTIAVVDADASGQPNAIYLVAVETGEKRRLSEPSENAFDHTPRFSPDGKSVAFVRSFGDFVQELMIVPADGGAARQLTFDKSKIRSLGWSADADQLYFVSLRANNQPNLWQISRHRGGEPQLISTGGKNIRNMAVSPDRKSIAFVEESEDSNIRRIEPDGAAPKFIASARADHSPHAAPDGTRVAFVSDRSGNGEIWIADANGNNQRQLTASNNPAGSPRVSPDGKTIVFDQQTGESSSIFTVPVEGGTPRRLTDSRLRDVLPAWSADGRTVYFTSNRSGDYQIWKVSAGGGEAVQLTRGGGFESFAAPDGRTLFYSKGRGIAGIWQISIDGGKEQPHPALADAGFWRSWTVTTGGVYFAAYSPAPPYQIKFYEFSSGQTKIVGTVEKSPLRSFSSLSAAADGKTILYAQSDQNSSQIMLAEIR